MSYDRWDLDKATHRLRDGKLSTTAKPKFRYAQIAPGGRIHIIESAIIRWNFHGGTFAKPDITYVALCGPQRHHVHPVIAPNIWDLCARCDSKSRWP